MSVNRYTAKLYFNGQVIAKSLGNDLPKMVVRTLTMLDTERGSVSGVILDNYSGKVVHRSRKATVE